MDLKAARAVLALVLCLTSLVTFLFVLSSLAPVPLPDGHALLFFAGAYKASKGIFDVSSTHPFSLLVTGVSHAFGLDLIFSMKLAVGLVSASLPVLLYMNVKFLSRNEFVGLLSAVVGPLVMVGLVWGGDYDSILGLSLFMWLNWSVSLYTKEPRTRNLLPLIAFPVLVVLDFLLASASIATLVLVSFYLVAVKKRLSVALLFSAAILVFVAMTFHSTNREWVLLASTAMFGRPSILSFNEGSWATVPLALSFLSATAGLVCLYVRKRFDELVVAFPLFVFGMCLAFVASSYAVLLVLPLSLLPLDLLRQSYSLEKQAEGGDEIVVITLQGERLLASLLSAMAVVSLLNTGYYVVTSSPVAFAESRSLEDLMGLAGWMMSNLTRPGLIATTASLGPFFEGFLGSRVLSWKEPQNAFVLDAANETCFRILSPYLLVDELEPLLTSRSPSISAYDGSRYVPLLYFADSYVMFDLRHGGKAFSESLYGSTLVGYSIDESDQFLELAMDFVSAHLNVSKTIRVSKHEPSVSVVYNATVRSAATMSAFAVPVWVAWGSGITRSVTSGSKVFLVLGSSGGQRSLEVDFKDSVAKPVITRSETGQQLVRGVFQAKNNSVVAEVDVKITSAVQNSVEATIFSIFDLPKTRDVRYFLVSNSSPALSGTLERRYEVLYVMDSFVRFSFTYDDQNYTEAPAYAKVTNETLYDGDAAEFITYQTCGLIISKNVTYANGSLTLVYHATGANRSDPMFQGLVNASLEIWVPWDRNAKLLSGNGTETLIVSDMGMFRMGFCVNVSSVKLEPHPTYKQPRIIAVFNLSDAEETIYDVTIGVWVTCDGKNLDVTHRKTTRPIMNGSDVLRLYVTSKPFEWLYSSGPYVLLEVLEG